MMKNVAVLCCLFLLGGLNSLAQNSSPNNNGNSQLSKLQTDYDPASGLSPLTLLASPKDGVAYYELKVRARQLYGVGKFAEAEPLLERLVREYPRDPENWEMLAFTKDNLHKPLEAIPAHEQAGKLIGWDLEFWHGYVIAVDYLAAGNKRAALDALKQMVFERHGFVRTGLYDRDEFASLRNDPEFLELVARPDTTGWSREKGWGYDLDLLYNEVKRVNPDYRDKPFPAEFTRRYAELRGKIARLSDEEIYVGMGRMLAVLHQGHIALFNPPKDRYLPVHLYAFPEGIFIIDATDEHKNLLGSRVLAFGSMPAEEALRQVALGRSVDGDMLYLWSGPALLGSAYQLKGIGATNSLEAVPLTIQQPDGNRRTVTLATLTSPLAPRMDKLVAPPNVAPPLFLSKMQRQVQELHWEVALPKHDALYVQVNNLVDEKDETLAQFGERLWTVLEKSHPKNVILDLRHNNGGTTQNYPELLRTLVAFSRVRGNQLYALIGRRSYSATGNFVTDLERLAAPIFVGEDSSECCSLYGDPVSVRLPYSGVQAELTAVKWQLSSPGDRRREMSPQVPVQLTAEAYFKGQDPALEAVYRLIAAGRARAGTR
ncbi:MAG TPA: tetratricopeptide repeat protein [Pyrinomonadaceae bacterium]|nr:tetratricopeptide repeat protein [Pyrinomonadaceae bacterium]